MCNGQLDAAPHELAGCQADRARVFITDALEIMKPESIKLTPKRKAALQRIARRTGSLSVRTARPGPSWRTLINRIADGDLHVI